MTRLAAFVFALPLLAAEPRPLPVSAEAWTPEVSNTGPAAPSGAVRMAIVACPRGQCLSVGQWRAGRSARYRYATPIAGTAGVVRGWYLTEGLYPRQASVSIRFYKGEERVSDRSVALDAAPKGAAFAAPVTHAPAGATSLVVAVGLTEQTEGSVLFGGLAFDPTPSEPAFPSGAPPLKRAAAPARFAPGKYFRIERQGNTWWLVTPQGKPFYSVGIAPPGFKEEGQGREYLVAARSLGFNSLSGWHDVRGYAALNDKLAAEGGTPMPQFYALQTRTGENAGFDTVMDAGGAAPGTPAAQAAARGGFNHALPDPYDPRWEGALRGQVRQMAAIVKDKPYFLAWFADNERELRDLYRYVWSPHAAAAFRALLEKRYANIAALNKSWGASFASFDDLAARRPEPALGAGPMYQDFHAFSRELLRRYNDILLRTIREEDPGRLVFTNRFMLGNLRSLVENLDLCDGYDAIAVNLYPANNSLGLAPHELAALRLIHEKSGKPLLLGEWSVPARDSGLYDNPQRLDWSWPQTVATQRDRGNQTARVQADFYNLPFMLGAHFFIWRDFDSPVRQANRGIFKVSGEPWRELQDALRQVNLRIQKAIEGR
jgi:hypothetical protein